MYKYTKKILFSFLILVTPYMNSASNAMNAEDYDSSTVRTRKLSFVKEDRQDILSFAKPSTTSTVVNLEDSQNSWMSYLSSPVKTAMQMTKEFISLANNNPRLAMVVGVAYLMPSISAGCICMCRAHEDSGMCSTTQGIVIGCASTLMECANSCLAGGQCPIFRCGGSCNITGGELM